MLAEAQRPGEPRPFRLRLPSGDGVDPFPRDGFSGTARFWSWVVGSTDIAPVFELIICSLISEEMQVTSPRHMLSREMVCLAAPLAKSCESKAWALAAAPWRKGPQRSSLRLLDSGSCEKELSKVKCTGRESVEAVDCVRRQPLASWSALCPQWVIVGFWVGATKHYSSEGSSLPPERFLAPSAPLVPIGWFLTVPGAFCSLLFLWADAWKVGPGPNSRSWRPWSPATPCPVPQFCQSRCDCWRLSVASQFYDLTAIPWLTSVAFLSSCNSVKRWWSPQFTKFNALKFRFLTHPSVLPPHLSVYSSTFMEPHSFGRYCRTTGDPNTCKLPNLSSKNSVY